MIFALLLLLVIIAAPFLWELRRPKMTEEMRHAAKGRFVKLSQGVTHYEWFGNAMGPTMVMVHGLTTPSFVWRGMTRALAMSGYRVLTYDLYGRGYSDRPRGRQDAAFFIQQLNDLLAHEKVEDDITVVGYSMGGAIATAFAHSDPDRIRQVVLLAPAGIRTLSGGLLGLIRDTPFVGDWLIRVIYGQILRTGIRAERKLPSSVPDIADLQLAELKTRGYFPAVLSSLRGILAFPLEEEHKILSARGVRLLAIWGGKDDLIPKSTISLLAEWNHDAHQEVIEGAGHGLTYTHTEQVLTHMRGFMKPPPTLRS